MEDMANEVQSQLDLAAWFADAAPIGTAQHASYWDVTGALEMAMGLAHTALERAATGKLGADAFTDLTPSLHEFDRSGCADILDAVITHSLTDVDAFTGVFNRAALDLNLSCELVKAARNGKSLNVAMIDANSFKVVNGTYGHACDGVVLRKPAERFMESLRTSDLLYRYGGEDFLVALPDTSQAQAKVVLDRLRKKASASPISKGAMSVTQCVSVGIALHSVGESPLTLVARSDEALYNAKTRGRNRGVGASATGAALGH